MVRTKQSVRKRGTAERKSGSVRLNKRAAADDSEADSDRPTKRTKATFNAPIESPKQRKDGEGNDYWKLNKTGNRRVTILDFKGKSYVNIREYYEKDGELLPGKKGIMMAPDQFSVFLSALPQIESALDKKGVQVPRPDYSAATASKVEHEDDEDEEEEQAEESEEEEKDLKPTRKKKAKAESEEDDSE